VGGQSFLYYVSVQYCRSFRRPGGTAREDYVGSFMLENNVQFSNFKGRRVVNKKQTYKFPTNTYKIKWNGILNFSGRGARINYLKKKSNKRFLRNDKTTMKYNVIYFFRKWVKLETHSWFSHDPMLPAFIKLKHMTVFKVICLLYFTSIFLCNLKQLKVGVYFFFDLRNETIIVFHAQ